MPKQGSEVKPKGEEKSQTKVMYSVNEKDAPKVDTTSSSPPSSGRPLSFGILLARVIGTAVFLTFVALSAAALTFYVVRKEGPAQQAVDLITNNYLSKKDVPKQIKLLSLVLVGVAFAHTVVTHIVALFAKQVNLRKGVDLANPRSRNNDLTGFAQRAYNAHLNSHEAFPGFAAGVVCAVLAGVPPVTVATLALGFIGFRTVYYFVYWFNIPPVRSVVWFGGVLCTLGLFATMLNPVLFDSTWEQLSAQVVEILSEQVNTVKKTVAKEL